MTGHNIERFCRDCVKYKDCSIRLNEQLRESCKLLQDDAPLRYRNNEGYADPTAYLALRNVQKEQRKRNCENMRKTIKKEKGK